MSTSLWTKAERFEPRPIASPDALTRGLTGLMDRLARAIRRRRTYAELAVLDDRALRAICLDRGMVPGVSERTSSRALAAHEAARAEARTWLCVLGGGA